MTGHSNQVCTFAFSRIYDLRHDGSRHDQGFSLNPFFTKLTLSSDQIGLGSLDVLFMFY
jgi:hypothetical protein